MKNNMTNFSNAIKLAMEGGYNNNYWDGTENSSKKTEEQIILDPLFWQCLGKKLGWVGTMEAECPNEDCGACDDYHREIPLWQYNALLYFELVLTNGDTEKYWEELIGKGK